MRFTNGGLAALGILLTAGCAAERLRNSEPHVTRHIRAHHSGVNWTHFKSAVLYPGRDVLTAEPLWRLVFGGEAWNLAGDDVPDGSFFCQRTADELTPQRLAEGHALELAPRQPFHVDRVKKAGSSGFFGTDAAGRKYLVKVDDPDYPELGTAATIIATRIYHALGFYVPPTFLVTLSGTGDPRFDGRRATASPLIKNVIGSFHYDWFRHRREVRAIRMVAAWLNDCDRGPNNNLVAVEDGAARYYLIDFNSTLGSWQGRPKEPWRGRVYAVGSGDPIVRVLTLGLLRPRFDPDQPVISPAVGRFDADYDPMTWAPQAPNTAFDRMTAGDRNWIIRRIAQLQRPHLEAVVAGAGLSSSEDREYLVETLLARQARILELGSPPLPQVHVHATKAAR